MLTNDLDDLIAGKEIGHRADALRRITDLFVSSSGQISDDQIALFDDVMGKLVREIDASARVAFSTRMASMPDMPPQVIRTLALDDDLLLNPTYWDLKEMDTRYAQL